MSQESKMQENEEGYLLNHQTWAKQWAEQKALEKNLVLQEFDWQVIIFARNFYQQYQVMPLTRRIIKFIRENLDQNFDSIKLQECYSDKPLRIIALLAGLPKPIQCI